MARIVAQDLSKSFGGKPAVSGLSFEVEPGTVTGFLGPNGSGKSTTMRLMLDLDRGGGRTTFDGRGFTELDQPMRHVGALLEAKPFHPTRRAEKHLRMLAAANRLPARRVGDVLDLVGLHEVARGRPKSFSLGMGQRLGLAAALLGDPHTLILDEPANGLDPQGIQWMRRFLRSLAAEGRSVFVSSHLLSEMALLADRLVVIGQGRLIATGPVHEFVATAGPVAVEVDSPDADTLARLLAGAGATVTAADRGGLRVTGLSAEQIGDLAFDHGVRLHRLAPREATLEEAFLERTAHAEEFRAPAPPPGPPVAPPPDPPPGPPPLAGGTGEER